MYVLFKASKTLADQVARILKDVDLLPGECLHVSRTDSNNLFGGDVRYERKMSFVLENPVIQPDKLDELLSSPIETLELYHNTRRHRELHEAGVHFVGQLARMWPNKELGHKKGFGRHTSAFRRLNWALKEKKLEFGMQLHCGPKELECLRLVSIDSFLECATNCHSDRRITRPLRVSHFYKDELNKIGITTMWDIVHTSKSLVLDAFRNAVLLRNQSSPSPHSVSSLKKTINYERPEVFELAQQYLLRYGLAIGSLSRRKKKKV